MNADLGMLYAHRHARTFKVYLYFMHTFVCACMHSFVHINVAEC